MKKPEIKETKTTLIIPTFKSNYWGPFSGLKIQDLIKRYRTFPCGLFCPRSFWCYLVGSNFKWKIFSNFVAFSEYPNCNKYYKYYSLDRRKTKYVLKTGSDKMIYWLGRQVLFLSGFLVLKIFRIFEKFHPMVAQLPPIHYYDSTKLWKTIDHYVWLELSS